MSNQSPQVNNYLGIDYGEKRVGVARASAVARLPEPLITLPNSEHIIEDVIALAEQEDADVVVVGYPRGLDGQITEQTRKVQLFIDQLQAAGVTTSVIDEAGTSVAASEYLRSKDRPHWKHEGIDAIAAVILLTDYLEHHS